MFSSNAGHMKPGLQQAERFWKHSSKGQLIIKFFSSLEGTTPSEGKESGINGQSDIFSDHNSRDRFMDTGNAQLLDIALEDETTNNDDPIVSQDGNHQSPPRNVPIAFVRYFCLKKVFSIEFENIEFDYALVALDYLQGLEWTRREVMREVIIKFGITEYNWQEALSGMPAALDWAKYTRYWNTGLELCFAELWMGLRIWIMVHELRAINLVENEALAMLNTLFPPSTIRLPQRISQKAFYLLRATFYQYLYLAKTDVTGSLDSYIENLERPGSKYAWRKVRACVADYIQHVDDMMQKTLEVHTMECFRDENGDNIVHRQLPTACNKADDTRLSQQSESPTLSSLSRTSSTDSDSAQKIYYPDIVTPPIPMVRTKLNDIHDVAIMPMNLSLIQESEVGRCENPSSEVRRRVFREQRAISLSGRPITSDDVILPGTPLLPDTPEATEDSYFNIPGTSSSSLPCPSQGTPHLDQDDCMHQPSEPRSSRYGRQELKSKASFTNLLRKKISVGSSRTLRESFKSQNGLGISLDPSKPAENLPGIDLNIKSDEPGEQKEHINGDAFEDMISRNRSLIFRSETLQALRAPASRGSSQQLASIEDSVPTSSRIAQKIRKKRSLPAIFSRKKCSPSKRDSEPIYFKSDGDYEKYALLSELQPVKSLPIMQGHKLEKAKSCFALKSVPDSQATIDSKTPSLGSTKGKKLTKVKSIATFKTAPDSLDTLSKTIQRKKLQKLQKFPKIEPNICKQASLQTPVLVHRSLGRREHIRFVWDPNSDDWKSREYTRQYYLEKYRAQRFDLRDPDGGPYRPSALTSDGIERLDRPRATPKDLTRPNAQRSDSIFQRRGNLKIPTSKIHTMIDINKYAK